MNRSNNYTTTANNTCHKIADVYETLQQICKVISVVFYWLFLFLIFAIKQHRNKNLAFLINMDLIGVYTLTFYSFFSFSTSCEASSQSLCEYQSLFVYYSIYMSAYNVVFLSLYRLACTSLHNIDQKLTGFRILLCCALIWIFPIFTIVIPAHALNIRIYYDEPAAACRMDLTNQMEFFVSYLIIGNILPSLLVFVVNFKIFWNLRKSKQRIHAIQKDVDVSIIQVATTTQRQTNVTTADQDMGGSIDYNTINGKTIKKNTKKLSLQYRLLIQLSVLFIVFEIYAVSNILLLLNTTSKTTIFKSSDLRILRVFRWTYHALNPIIYLFLNPIILEKSRALFVKYYKRIFNKI